MKKYLLLIGVFMLAVVLVACSNGDKDDAEGSDDNNDGVTVDVDVAEALYKDSCSSCHGNDLEGDYGPSLKTIGNDMSEDEIRKKIKDGGDDMPAEVLKGDDADQVAAWLATLK